MKDVPLSEIYTLLCQSGFTANYNGFGQAAVAIQLTLQNPEYLLVVSKRLYPEVAKQFGTSWQCVERNIRTMIQTGWQTRPQTAAVQWHGSRKPTTSQFIALMASYFLAESVPP